MKTALLLLVTTTFGTLASCSGRPSASPNERAAEAPPKVPYEVVATHTKGGQTWKHVVVAPLISDSDLIALAKELHAAFPKASFNIFDDAAQITAYVNWDKNYPSDAYPYPEGWLKKHHLGIINKMAERGGARWQLLGGDAYHNGRVTVVYLE